MLLSILSWIFIWGSTSSFGTTCPEANLRVRSSYVPVYALSHEAASSETLEDGDIMLKYGSVIKIPPEYVACSKDGKIDYRRSLMRWSNQAKDLNQTQYAKFAEKQNNTDVFFPIKLKKAVGNLPDYTSHLNLITLLNNGFLAEGEDIPKDEKGPIAVVKENIYRFNSTDLYAGNECYVVRTNGVPIQRCGVLVKAQASPVNINDDSKNHGKLEVEKLECEQGGKNICEDIRPVMPRLPRDFMARYQSNNLNNQQAVLETFVESHLSYAVWQQTQTGIPASQFLAQLMHETGKGSSRMYQVANAVAGLSCGYAMNNVAINVDFYGNQFNIMDTDCSTRRPEGGHYFSYASLEEGMLHWSQNFIKDGSPYPTIREASKKSKASGAYGVNPMLIRNGNQCGATPDLAAALRTYAVDPNYTNVITGTMCELEKKYDLANHPCQVCLQKQWERKVKGTGLGVTK